LLNYASTIKAPATPNFMNKKELLTKLKEVESLSKDEKTYLTNLIKTKKYGVYF